MYPVSEAFLSAVQENTRRYYWTGKITTKAGVVHEFSEKEIVKGSGYISAQCCDSNEMELGTVYASEMGITLFLDVDRYTLEDAKVELFYHLELEDSSWEEVPMGIFEVSEANRKIKCLDIKAYDYMLRFDEPFNGFETVGNAYDFMELCSKACRVELAQTREEIEAMPNGAEVLSVYTENDIETYRDMLYYVGQVLGGFFCINRVGKLELRKYGSEPVMEIGSRHRFSSSFSDFITRYTAVSSTNLKTEMAEYYALEPDDGLTMNLGTNPLLQFGVDETRKELCTNILNDLAVINYVPFDSETIGNPALELGDVLKFSGGHADGARLSAVMSIQIKIGGKQTLKGVGKNPRLARAKSKNDKNISGLLNQIEENKTAGKIGIHTFTNASAFSISDTDTKIISIEFATSEEVMAQFFGSVIVDVKADPVEKSVTAKTSLVIPAVDVTAVVTQTEGKETEEGITEEGTEPDVIGNTKEQTIELEVPVAWNEDGMAVAHFIFEFNDVVIDIHQPEETWHSGRHTIMLYYPIDHVIANYRNIFNVYMRMESGNGNVETGNCLAAITGQSMGAGEAWDGEIRIEEKITAFSVGTVTKAVGLSDSVSFKIDETMRRAYADVLTERIKIGAFTMPIETEG
nr:MAG TPA: hypothetical protein [Caudoviricetes sp.]